MLLFGKLLTLCFDKFVVKHILSLILAVLRFSNVSGSNFFMLNRDSIPERLDLTWNPTSIFCIYFLQLIIITFAFSFLSFAINFAFS